MIFGINRYRERVIFFLIFTLGIFVGSANALAQRGATVIGSPKNFHTPTQGFPGFFDTNMAEKDSLVVEYPPIILPFIPIPSVAVDYGVTDTFTIGTNAFVDTVPWLLGAKAASIKARGLIYGDETHQSTATIYAGVISKSSLFASWQMLTSNNAWKIAPNHVVYGQLGFLKLGFESGDKSGLDYTNLSFSTLAIGGGYQYIYSETLGFSGHALLPILSEIEADTVAASISAKIDARSNSFLWATARASMDIRRENWVYSIGALHFQKFMGFAPWLSATKRW